MVLLRRIYSKTGLFDEVTFHKGVNIILAKYSQKKKYDEYGKPLDINGVGKSTLVRLIDFSLLADEGRNNFFDVDTHDFLKNHSVSLDFSIGSDDYSITRPFQDYSAVTFGKNGLESDFRDTELRRRFEGLFFKSENREVNTEGLTFRNLLRFFVKDDLSQEGRKDPFNFIDPHISQYDVYAYNLFLLGLPSRNIHRMSELNKDIKHLDDQGKTMRKKVEEETGRKIEALKSDLILLDGQIGRLENATKNYRLKETYEDIEKDLIDISCQMTEFLSDETTMRNRLEVIRSAYDVDYSVDDKRVVRLYRQVNEEFSNVIKRKLEEVIRFRVKLAENRKKFLAERETELSQEIEKISKCISELEARRIHLYTLLDERNALDSIKNTYSRYIEEKAKKEALVSKLGNIKFIEDGLAEKQTQKSETIKKVYDDIARVDEKIKNIRKLFLEIMHATVFSDCLTDATFDISAQPGSERPFKMKIDVPKSESQGRNRLTMLSYDLTVFFNIVESGRGLPHFLVHDGAIHGIAPRTVIKALNFVNSKSLQNQNFQYILTANESELFFSKEKSLEYGQFSFDLDAATIAVLTEKPEGMLFKREYM